MIADISRAVSVEIASPAYVLRTRPYGELDVIATLLTERHGKITGIAKAAKHSRRRFGGTLQPFVHVRAVFKQRPRSDLVFLVRWSCYRAPSSEDLDRFAAGSYVIDLTDRMTVGRESPRPSAADEALWLLDRGMPIDPLCAFELHLLATTGYEPADRCRAAARTSAARTLRFAVERGGLPRRRCVPPGGSCADGAATARVPAAPRRARWPAVDVGPIRAKHASWRSICSRRDVGARALARVSEPFAR